MHMQHLGEALAKHGAHPRYEEIAKLAQEILGAFKDLAPLPDLPLRLAHGDLKVSNILFDRNRGKALVDLDTLARLPLAIELGDALRSWCNPAAEDTTETTFDLSLARAALGGYFEVATFATEQERRSIAQGTLTISLELAARFCADALEERYFGWNPARFASRSEHNLVRGIGQLNVFKSLHAQASEVVAACLAL
jgi:aminoglycoside phosphotransferase (APT) family kinase protein